MGKTSLYIVIPLVCIAVVMGFGVFFAGASQVTSTNPIPSYPNANQTFVGPTFFTNLNGFVANIDSLGKAIARITPTTGPQYTDLTAYVDTGVAIIKVMIGIPVLVVSFLYDMIRVLLFFLPAVAPPEFLAMIAILVLIPIVYILMEIAAAIRGRVGTW